MRMPRFAMSDTERAALIGWFATADETPGIAAPAPPQDMPSNLEDVAVSLMGPKGFSCAHCHSLGQHQPITDTPAPDLAMVGQRISRSWFHRWLDDPARVRPGTPMPAFVRPAPGIAGDDLDVQKETLWAYLTTTPPEEMVLAAEPERMVPFAERCAAVLVDYLDERGTEPGPLFLAATHLQVLTADVALRTNGLKQLLRRLGKRTGIEKVHAHRFRHTFATWAIQHDARELDVQYLLGHSSPDMVRRYSSSYRSEQAALRHVSFSPADQMLGDGTVTEGDERDGRQPLSLKFP